MATNKSTTKTLKAKTTTTKRAKAKKRRRTACPVAELARKIDKIAPSINYAHERVNKEPAGSAARAHWQETMTRFAPAGPPHRSWSRSRWRV
jgi:hypothetical protein